MPRFTFSFFLFIASFNVNAQIDNFNLKCFGTEPFWNLEISKENIKFGLYDELKLKEKISVLETSANHTNRWFIKSFKEDSNSYINLESSNNCSDDMSDRVYLYNVSFFNQSEGYFTGCCTNL